MGRAERVEFCQRNLFSFAKGWEETERGFAEQGFAGAGWAGEKEIMVAGNGNLKSAFAEGLAGDVVEGGKVVRSGFLLNSGEFR